MSEKSSRELQVNLLSDKLEHTLTEAKTALDQFRKLAIKDKENRLEAMDLLTKFALSINAAKIDKDFLESFFQYPYCVLPGKNEREHFLVIPKFIDVHFGWLHKVTASFLVF